MYNLLCVFLKINKALHAPLLKYSQLSIDVEAECWHLVSKRVEGTD